ncbi:25729_t:CDS:2 [Dentiscutata erythropus]|uniref:25729_t:CDS:1 n=1 Tax=Dentiscutata erythropus TaxID=1348616 RepID=A0A9N9BE79_9GLOM|nr:25729_t:CDS:2 [Dentiscutata erythropus]
MGATAIHLHPQNNKCIMQNTKIEKPSATITFLRIMINTITMMVSITTQKPAIINGITGIDMPSDFTRAPLHTAFDQNCFHPNLAGHSITLRLQLAPALTLNLFTDTSNIG